MMSDIGRLYRTKAGVLIPKRLLKEHLDEKHRRLWEDDNRYSIAKAKALRYIPVRASAVQDVDRLVREVARVFHDDLVRDPEVREAAQRVVHFQSPAAESAAEDTPAETRVGDLTDEKIADLEWQRKEEETEP